MIKNLVKIQIACFLGSLLGKKRDRKAKKANKVRIAGIFALILYIVGISVFLVTEIAIQLGKALIPAGMSWLYFAVFTLISLSTVFLFSIFETKSLLFECKDNELLTSMPIKPGDIVASRAFTVVIYNYLIELLVMAPVITVYGIISKDAGGVLGASLISLFIPLIAVSLAAGVGFLIALISKRISKNSFLTVGIAIIFLLSYFYAYSFVMENFEAFIESISTVGKADLPLLFYIGSASLFHAVSTPTVIAAAIIIAALTYFIIARNYIKIVSSSYVTHRKVYKNGSYKSMSALRALVSKELKAFFSSANYMLNSGLGLILEVVIAVFAVVKREYILESFPLMFTALGFAAPPSDIAPIMIAAIVFATLLNTVSSCALSLEGKRLWILKSIPISDRDALLSKMLPHIILTAPPTLICSVAFIIASSAPIEEWIFFILTPLAANVFAAIFGVLMNVLFPKFEYTNEAQAIKQSVSVFVTMMTCMLGGVGIMIGSFLLVAVWPPLLVSTLLLAIFALLSLIMYFVLMGPVKRRYSSIST